MTALLECELQSALSFNDHALERVVAVLRRASGMDRVSAARLHPGAATFEIVAAEGAELLAPGCQLPVATCTYFATTARGEEFAEASFARSRAFDRPLDGIVEAAGFKAGGSAPVRANGAVLGAISFSSGRPEPSMRRVVHEVASLAPMLAPAFEPGVETDAQLTPREHELLLALDEGLRFKQIALRLRISEATAKTHGRHLFRKLDATSRAEAVHTARVLGLLE